MDEDTVKEVRNLKRGIAFAGFVIVIYNFYYIEKFNFNFNIFTEGSYVMMFVGLILIFTSFKKTDTSIMEYLSKYIMEIIVYGSLLFLIFYVIVIN